MRIIDVHKLFCRASARHRFLNTLADSYQDKEVVPYRKVLDPARPETYNQTARNMGRGLALKVIEGTRLFVSEEI